MADATSCSNNIVFLLAGNRNFWSWFVGRSRNSQRNSISVGGTKGRYLWPLFQRTFAGTFRNLCLMATKTMSVIIY